MSNLTGPRRPALTLLAALALGGVTLFASSPTFWTVATQAEFLRGDVENLSIDSDGRVLLGPSLSLVADTPAPFLWAIAPAPDGGFYAGSGNEGRVIKVGADGKTSTFFDAQELEVHALAAAPNGGLYAATSPDGRIYHLASDGTSAVLFDPDDKYIWALATDARGTVYAATGDKGVIYKITPEGTGTVFYKTNATNVVSLAVTAGGDLIAGTESPGRVLRIDPSGKPFVLLDSPFKEIHALRLAPDGTIYAAAMSPAPSGGTERPVVTPPDDSRPPVPTVTTEVTAVAVAESAPGPSPPPGGRTSTGRSRGGRGAIYRITADGFADNIWETGEDLPYDQLVECVGRLLVAPGTEG
jgi:hypothetical protein